MGKKDDPPFTIMLGLFVLRKLVKYIIFFVFCCIEQKLEFKFLNCHNSNIFYLSIIIHNYILRFVLTNSTPCSKVVRSKT